MWKFFSRLNWWLLFFFSVAVIIKFHQPLYFATYNAEVAQHYLEIIQLHQGKLLLEGPLTSHPWLRLSATPYYFFYPLFAATGFHPLTLPLFWTMVSCVLIFLQYYVVKKIYDHSTATWATIVFLFSPNILILDHYSAFFNFVIPFALLLLLISHHVLAHQSQKIWLLFLLISLMITLHASALFLLPFFIGVITLAKKWSKQNLILSVGAFLVPQLPLLLNDAQHHFTTLAHLVLWIPYKILQFLSGTTLGVEKTVVADQSLQLVIDFLKLSIFPPFVPWWMGFSILVIILFWFGRKIYYRQFDFTFFLLSFLLFGITTLIIHKNPPFHYFVPIVMLPIILMGRLISVSLKKQRFLFTIFSIIGIILTLNLRFIFSSSYLGKIKADTFAKQFAISQVIYNDAQGQPFQLQRIGPFDYYHNEFKENYVYLLWWLGNAPVSEAEITYAIVEEVERKPAPELFTPLVTIDDVLIMKSNQKKRFAQRLNSFRY